MFCWLPTDIIICTGLEDGFACYSSDQSPDFVNVSPKNHLQIMGRYVDVVS